MRNIYLIISLSMIWVFSLVAKPTDAINSIQVSYHTLDDTYKHGISIDDITKIQAKDKNYDIPTLHSAYKILETNQDFFWTGMRDGLSPFTYEPKSNTLIYITTGGERYGENRAAYTAHVYLHFSQDGGNSWQKELVYEKDGSLAMLPSVAVLNPNNETDPKKFKIVVAYSYYTAKPTPENPLDTLFYPTGNNYVYFNGEDGWDGFLDFDELGPTKNNPGGAQEWAWTQRKMLAVSSEKGDHFYVYGTLSAQTGYQYGAYGISYVDFTESDPDPNSQIPPQWDMSQFKPSTDLDRSYNAQIKISADSKGNLYAIVYNIFGDVDTEERTAGFSKSTDNGVTWSEFQTMPQSIKTDYLSNWAHNSEFWSILDPYSSWDAIVTGEDELSVYLRLRIVNGSGNNATATFHIVEASYKNGSWLPLRKVSELYDIVPISIRNVGRSIPKDTVDGSYRLNEIEAARTADGNSIVLKFVDCGSDYNIGVLNNRVSMVGNPLTYIDSLATTDVFFAYRNLNDDNWTVKNATQDKWYNRGTYMPNIVPSVSEIPVAEYATDNITIDPENENPRTAYPLYILNLLQDRDGSLPSPPRNTLLVGTFDFNNPSPINNPTIQIPRGLITSVLETLPFALNDIAPNPANDATTLSFNLDYSAEVVVNIHNAMGQIVKNVYNGYANSGMNTINILTNDLPAGAYFYTINVNGKSQTKLLNVVR